MQLFYGSSSLEFAFYKRDEEVLGETMTQQTPRFLITSLGSIGRRHLANLRHLYPAAQIAALRLAPRDKDLARATPDGADCQFDSLDAAIQFGPQAAIVASPAPFHIQIATALIQAGIPTLIEKPLSHSIEKLSDFVKLVQKTNVSVAIGYNMRFLPELAYIRSVLQNEELGRLLAARAEVGQYLPDWRQNRRYQDSVSARRALGGGALLELSHEIDYLYLLFGMPCAVTAQGGHFSTLEVDVEDLAEICLEYQKPSRLVSIHLDMIQRVPQRSCKLIFQDGTILWDVLTHTVNIYRSETEIWENRVFNVTTGNALYIEELKEFLEFASGRLSRLATVADGYAVMRIIDASMQSIKTKQTVEIKHDAINE